MHTTETLTPTPATKRGSGQVLRGARAADVAPPSASPAGYLEVELALAFAQEQGTTFVLAHFEIDDLNSLNDLWGTRTGDHVLAGLAARLKAFRYQHAKFGVCRRRGDAFLLFGELPSDCPEVVTSFARLLTTSIGAEFEINGHARHVPISLGVSVAAPLSTVASMLLEARSAMVLGRRDRREIIVICDRTLPTTAQLLRALPGALSDGQIYSHFQPTVDTRTGQIVHVEALARWTTPSGETIGPGVFVPIIEAYGLAGELCTTVLRCVSHFLDDPATPEGIRVWVNISPYQLQLGNFAAQFLASLARIGIAPHRIGVELTESAAVADPSSLAAEFRVLQQHGIEVAIDDFGSGYSPLGYLPELAADLIKLDRSLISGIDTSAARQHMVAGIVAMVKELGAAITVEGVEQPGEQAWLHEHGLHQVQGFLWARPCEPSQFDWSPRCIDATCESNGRCTSEAAR